MADLLKNLYSKEFVNELSSALKNSTPLFDHKKFDKAVFDKNWANRELKDRMHHITEMISICYDANYLDQLKTLSKIAPNFKGFPAVVFPNFVEKYGQTHHEKSLEALAHFTKFSTSEFAIRPFLKSKPDTIEMLYSWSKDKNFHVRRLSSEGCRPLLPWAMKLEQYVKDPLPIIPILVRLKNDKEDYVYRSVANNLNDISKNHPALVLDLAEKWIGQTNTTDRVLKHALRTLLKKGNQSSMKLFGFGSTSEINVNLFSAEKSDLKIGDSTRLFFSCLNIGKSAKFRFEYEVSYLKKNNSYNKKVFQISEKELAKKQSDNFSKKIDFKNLSTRKHYSGLHYVTLKINGVLKNRIEINLK